METPDNKSRNWSKYYENQKKLWYDPHISVYIKALVRIVELHRSDSKGWCISIRRIVSELGITRNTVLKHLNDAIDKGYIETSSREERKRRKLKLSVSLRAPVEFNLSKTDFLSQPVRQPVLRDKPESVLPVATINSKENIKAINNKSQLNKNRIESRTSTGWETPQSIVSRISPSYQKLKEKRKELGI